ncbi:MAG: hypothetical protein V7718_01775 [Porticoccus sp.]
MYRGKTGKDIKNWKSFSRDVRGTQECLLGHLDEFPDSVLVTGCQRSGGTMLAGLITKSEGMVNYQLGDDGELDAALLLSGQVSHEPIGRYCFQTTYLNERFSEYLEHPAHYIIWLLRNPHSVVYSMVYNWKRFALNELFLQCGYAEMNYRDRVRFQRFGILGIPPLRRAAYSYNGKVSQLFKLREGYAKDRLIVLDYDNLIRAKERLLPILYERIHLAYDSGYAASISERSLNKKNSLRDREKELIDAVCMPTYNAALILVNLV